MPNVALLVCCSAKDNVDSRIITQEMIHSTSEKEEIQDRNICCAWLLPVQCGNACVLGGCSGTMDGG
jgi:hypothetical protein